MSTNKTVILFILLALVSVTGVYYNNVKNSVFVENTCDLSREKCAFDFNGKKISVKFLSKIITEEEILLSIDLPDGLIVKEGWIEGVNMYMGKTPIIKQGNEFVTFLGSCNLAKMEWRLHFSVEDENGQVKNYSAAFYTTLE
jgi:hypothetical protein